MTFCVSRNFTIDFERDIDGVLLDSLFFQLQIKSGAITGEVFPSVGTKPLSKVTGTCQSFSSPDVSLFTMNFTWDTVAVSVVGVVFFHRGKSRIMIEGRFVADAHVHAQVSEVTRDPDMKLIPPSDGDTGTASGQST